MCRKCCKEEKAEDMQEQIDALWEVIAEMWCVINEQRNREGRCKCNGQK